MGIYAFTWSFSQSTIFGNLWELKWKLLDVTVSHRKTKPAYSQREGVHPVPSPSSSHLTSLSLSSHLPFTSDGRCEHCRSPLDRQGEAHLGFPIILLPPEMLPRIDLSLRRARTKKELCLRSVFQHHEVTGEETQNQSCMKAEGG